MCLVLSALDSHSEYSLIVAANRDEFYDRPSAKAAYWEDRPEIYGGRDLVSGGTWLGVTTYGRFAAVTNYRDPSAPIGTVSRGKLVADFLCAEEPAAHYLDTLKEHSSDY